MILALRKTWYEKSKVGWHLIDFSLPQPLPLGGEFKTSPLAGGIEGGREPRFAATLDLLSFLLWRIRGAIQATNQTISKRKRIGWAILALILLSVQVAWADAPAAPPRMHIMEGFLPLGWALFWWVVAIPFWALGLRQVRALLADKPEQRLMLGLAGGFIFVLSALKIPSVTGSSSHPTGTGLGTMLFGPFVIAILGTIALIFQALLLAHGGISTLGANAMSMAIGGPLIAYYAIWLPLRGKAPIWLTAFLTAFIADLATYLITTSQLALAFPDPVSGFIGSWVTFASIFAVTQMPLALAEGILVVLIFNFLQTNATSELNELGLEGV